MVAIMVGSAAVRLEPSAHAARSVWTVLLITVVPIALLMARQVRRGAWENVDASNARERPILFACGAGALIILIGYFLIFNPDSPMIRGAVGVLAMLAVCALATRRLKVSLHMAFATLTTTMLILIGARIGWLVLAFLPVLAWSRLSLKRHRPAELLAGVLIGVATGLAIHSL